MHSRAPSLSNAVLIRSRHRGYRLPQGETEGLSSDASIRWDLVNRVREEIAAGSYDTPEKWDHALRNLLNHLDVE